MYIHIVVVYHCEYFLYNRPRYKPSGYTTGLLISGKLIFHSQKTSLIEKFLSICITNVFTYITIITGLLTVVKILLK